MLGEWYGYVAREVANALLLRPNLDVTFAQLELIAASIGLLVAISMLAGQSVILAINKVRGFAYSFLVLLTGLRVLAIVAVLTTTLWLLGLVSGTVADIPTMTHVVLLSLSPHLFAFVAIAPGIGPFLSRALTAWSFLILWPASAQAFRTDIWTALLISLTAGVITLSIMHLLGRPVATVRDRLWRRVTGRELRRSSRELLEETGLLEAGRD